MLEDADVGWSDVVEPYQSWSVILQIPRETTPGNASLILGEVFPFYERLVTFHCNTFHVNREQPRI